MRDRKFGIVLAVIGLMMILSAMLVLVHNYNENKIISHKSQQVLSKLKEANFEQIITNDSKEQVFSVDGYEYIGYIDIPQIKVRLPVLSQWDYTGLKLAPCRQFGKADTNDLVIAAHNYKCHFGNISKLNIGSSVNFTDACNYTHSYKVEQIKTLNPTDVENVQNSKYDLVLYTCNYSGKKRIAVFCNHQ